MSSKTEQPTDTKLKDAREKGDIPRSQAFTAGLTMAAWWLITPALAGISLPFLASYVNRLLSVQAHDADAGDSMLFLMPLAIGLSVPSLLAFLMTLMLGLAQTRGRLARKRQWVDFNRINPVSGLKQFFGLQRLFGVAMTLAKSAIVASACYLTGTQLLAELYGAPSDQPWTNVFLASLSIAWKAVGFSVLGCAVLGVSDLLVQTRLWKRRNKMSKDDKKREYRDQEGDPHVKAARRSIQRGMGQG